jgi:alcohol dehydrogenase (cytochrome c)
MCDVLKSAPLKYVTGKTYFGGEIDRVGAPGNGWIVAVDSDTGAVRWRYHTERPIVAGVTATAGGVVVTGDAAGNFLLLESATGKLLRKIETGGSMAGGVITYAIGAKQFVAFMSGNVSRTALGAIGVPTLIVMSVDISTGDAEFARGRTLFSLNCAACHGQTGENVARHSLRGITGRMHHDEIVKQIESPPPQMPRLVPTPLSEQDVKAIVAYLAAF